MGSNDRFGRECSWAAEVWTVMLEAPDGQQASDCMPIGMRVTREGNGLAYTSVNDVTLRVYPGFEEELLHVRFYDRSGALMYELAYQGVDVVTLRAG